MNAVTVAEWEALMVEAETDLAREMREEQAAVKRALIEDINELALIGESMRPLEARKRILTDRVKQGMALAGMDELADGETGVVARLQDRHSAPPYDLVSAAEAHPEAVTAAGKAGMLRIDHVSLERYRKGGGSSWADTIASCAGPEPVTTALIVEASK